MRKDLKKLIFESVSKLRISFTKIIDMHDEILRQNMEMENAVIMAVAEHFSRRIVVAMGHAATSCDRTCELPDSALHGEESKLPRTFHVMPSNDDKRKLVAPKDEKTFKITFRSKNNKPPDTIKNLLKSKVNPTEIKVWITSLKSLRD
jgi:hypothetical protein